LAAVRLAAVQLAAVRLAAVRLVAGLARSVGNVVMLSWRFSWRRPRGHVGNVVMSRGLMLLAMLAVCFQSPTLPTAGGHRQANWRPSGRFVGNVGMLSSKFI